MAGFAIGSNGGDLCPLSKFSGSTYEYNEMIRIESAFLLIRDLEEGEAVLAGA
jgi:hypothetical protein